MGLIIRTWRRLGTKLYLILGFAVFLTLASSAVGVYNFERSGDVNHRVHTESVPVLEASWAAAREGERLQILGVRASRESISSDAVGEALQRLEAELEQAGAIPAVATQVLEVQDRAYDLVEVIDNLSVNRDALVVAEASVDQLITELETYDDLAYNTLMQSVMMETDEEGMDSLWEDFAQLPTLDANTSDLGSRIFEAREQQLAYEQQLLTLGLVRDDAAADLDAALSDLLAVARVNTLDTVELSVASFDQGRVLLTAISLASVAVATFAAWSLVGRGLIRPLIRLSDRMRGMAQGDLETPVPVSGRDEIGELGDALEVFRQQALEVQRLNLVEKLYGELQEANAELRRIQSRLVAQEKLAALGQLVSGIAHEISNPLNFVKNFSEGAVELYEELGEMLEEYKDQLEEEDAELLDEIGQDMNDNLGRVVSNCERALTIVGRMQSLAMFGGEAQPADFNSVIRGATREGCDDFQRDLEDFSAGLVFDLDESIGDVMIVERDFWEALSNLATNACFAMQTKQEDAGPDYDPRISVSSKLEDNSIEVRLRDNGTGIPDGVLEQIFNPFFTTREGALGAGLGLPIAADVIGRMGGSIEVSTSQGEYTEFIIILPAQDLLLREEAMEEQPAALN